MSVPNIGKGIPPCTEAVRTIADLADSELIAVNHLAEAIQYWPRIGL